MSADYMQALRVQLAYAERRQYAGKITHSDRDAPELRAIDHAIDFLLAHGQPIYVARWVEGALWSAAAAVPADVTCQPELLPGPAGFVLLGEGRQITLTSNVRDALDGLTEARLDALGWVQIEGEQSHKVLTVVVPWLSPPTDPPGWGHYSLALGFPVAGTGTDGELIPPDTAPDGALLRRFLYALWAFMRERRVTTVTHRGVDRALRKQADKAGWTQEPIVQVVELRASESRAREPDAEHEEVDWSCRWVVRGHWHKYRYGDGTLRVRWLAPYVKGPPDKPLRSATKLLAVVK